MVVQVQQPPSRQRRDIFDVLGAGLQVAKFFTDTGRADEELEFRKKALEAQTGKAQKAQERSFQEKQAKESKERFTQFGDVQKQLKQDPIFRKAAEKNLGASQMRKLAGLARKGNQAAYQQMRVIVGRMNQPGVLTDRDLALLGGSQQIFDVIERAIRTRAVGDVRPQDIDALEQIGNVAGESAAGVMSNLRESVIESNLSRFEAAGIPGVDRKVLEDITNLNSLLNTDKASGLVPSQSLVSPSLKTEIETTNKIIESAVQPLPEDPVERGLEHLRRLRGQ